MVNKQIKPERYCAHCYLTSWEWEYFKRSLKLVPRHQKSLDLANIRRGMKVLDVGCGRGEVTLRAALTAQYAVGIDYSLASVRIAKH